MNDNNKQQCEICSRIFKTPHYITTVETITDSYDSQGLHKQIRSVRRECEFCKADTYEEGLINIFRITESIFGEREVLVKAKDNRHNKEFNVAYAKFDKKGELIGVNIGEIVTITGQTVQNTMVGDIFIKAIVDFTEQVA